MFGVGRYVTIGSCSEYQSGKDKNHMCVNTLVGKPGGESIHRRSIQLNYLNLPV